jgi:hypothetical protein
VEVMTLNGAKFTQARRNLWSNLFRLHPDGLRDYMEVLIGNVDELALDAMVKISKARDSVRQKTEVCTTHPSAPEAMGKSEKAKEPKKNEADL